MCGGVWAVGRKLGDGFITENRSNVHDERQTYHGGGVVVGK